MGTIQETGVKFVMQIDEAFKKFGLLEKSFDNLPLAAEKATNKMNNSFDESMTSIKKFDDLLSKSGKDFDTKAVQTELQKAQKEFTETGKVNKDTMQSLQKEIKNVDWKSLDVNSRQTFKNVIDNVNSVERNMKKLENVKFLESLPEDARNAGKQLVLLESDINKVSKSMKTMDDGADFSKLNKGLQTARNELNSVGKVSDSTMNAIKQDINSVDFSKLPESAKKAFNEIESKAQGLESSLKNIGKGADLSGVSGGMQDIANNSDEADGNVGLLAGTLGKFKGAGYAGIIAGVGAAFLQVSKGALDANDAVHELQVQTGETGKELEGLKKVMYDIYGNNFGENMADIADVLSTVKSATNLTGKELQKATENAILMRDSFEWEPEESMNAVRAMMHNFNISQEEAFNLLAQGRQQMGKGADDLLDTFKEYGSAFKEIGFSGEDAMNMMNNAMDAGIMNTDKAADAINEMSIRLQEGSKESNQAVEDIGLKAGDVQEAFSKGGKEANEMFYKIIDGLKNMDDPVFQNASGVAIFGTMWEDMGAKAMLALGDTKGEISKTKDALKSMNEVKYDNVTSAAQGVGRAFTANVLLPLQDKMMPAINGGINLMYKFANTIKKAFDSIKNIPATDILKRMGISDGAAKNIISWFNTLKKQLTLAGRGIWSFLKDGFVEVKKFITGPDGQALAKAFGNIVSAIVTVFKVTFPIVKFIVKSVWDNIVGVIRGGMQVIKGIIQVFSGLFTGDFRKMWEGVKNIFFGAIKLIWNGVQLLFYGKLLKGVVGFAKLFAGGLKTMWGNIVGFFKSFGTTLWKNTSSIFTNIWKSVSKIFGNLVKWLINSAKNMANSVGNWFKNLWTNSVKFLKSMSGGLSKIWSSIKSTAYNSGKYIFDKVTGFFKSLYNSSVKLITNLKNGLFNSWKSIKQHAYDAGKYVKDKVVGFIKDTWTGVQKWIGYIKDGFSDLKTEVVKKVKGMADGMSEKVVIGINVMVDGVNWVADKLGMGKPLSRFKYSTGTENGHPEDGWATVGDKGPGNGKGTREIVQFPNGRTALFEKETTFWMPKGTKVYNNQQTEEILAPTRYSTGNVLDSLRDKTGEGVKWLAGKSAANAYTNSGKLLGKENRDKALKATAKVGEKVEDVMEYASNPGKLLNLALSKFGLDLNSVKGLPGQLFSKAFSKLKGGAINLITKWFEEAMGGNADGSEILSFPKTTPYSPNARPPGYPFNANHYGIDLSTPIGTTLHAPTSGVLSQTNDRNGGLTAILKDKIYTQFFMHLSKVLKSGPVKQGEAIVKTGNSGQWTTGPHLHYQVRKNDGTNNWNTNTIDPEKFLKANGGGSKGGPSGVSGNARSWSSVIIKAANQMKVKIGPADVNAIVAQIQRESGGNQNIVQSSAVWDVNTASGNPAQGLLQYIPQTFRAYAVKGHGNIRSGYDQLLAFFNNSNWRRDNPGGRSGWGPSGTRRFANGGFTKGESYIAGEEYEEAIIPMDPKRKARANELLAQANYKVNGPVKYSTGTAKTHKVKYGDTLWDIANKNKTTVKFLQALNNIKNHLIYPGQIIKLTKVVENVGKNIKKHADTIKESVTKKSAKPQYKTVKASRADDLLKVATDLIAKANSNPDGKFYKENIALGKYITDKMKNVNTQALNSLYANIKAIIKKIDTTIKGNQNKVTKGKSSIVSLSDKNRDASYKLEQLYEEKKLNGATGYINVKTRLADGDTTEVSKQIANQKKKLQRSKQMILDFEKKEQQLRAKLKSVKTKKEKKQLTLDLLKAQERQRAWKKQNDKELAQLKKFEQEKYNLQNRYKITQKKIKGRSSKAIDNDIKKQKDLIAKNKKLIATTKSEGKLYNSQIKSLQALKKNEVLRADFIKRLYKQREALIEKLKVLKEKEAALKEAKVSYKEGIVDNLQGYAGFGAAKGNTARDFVEFMKYRLGRVRKFSANMTKLKEWGLDPQILQEMIAGGIESAMPKAEVLIAGGKGYISQINALQAEVNKAVEWIANKQTNNVFDSQIANVQAEIKSNQAQQNALNQKSRDYMTKKTTKKVAVTKPKNPATVIGTAKKYVTKTVNKDYKVQKGDTLSSIAKKYGVTVEQLKKLNNITSNTLKTNQVIKVPVKVQVEVDDKGVTTKKTTKTTTKTHAIKWGDTLGGIAKKYGTTVDELKKYNGLKSDTIIAGRTLKIPIKTEIVEIVSTKTVKKATPTTSKTVSKASTVAKKVTSYIVKTGDSLGLIAQKYKTTVAKIKSLNGLKSDLIHPKQKLKIPGYASGGIIDIPQIAWIAEGGFAESIISHDPSKRVQQQRIWKETGDRLGFDSMNSEQLRQMIRLMEQQLAVQGVIANKESVIQMDAKLVGKQVAPHVEEEIVRQQQFKNRGLANGR